MAKKQEMQSAKLAGNQAPASTQSHLDIAEIKEATILLRDGSLRAVVVVSSTNFSLKSLDEQNALVNGYQSFLNALDFPVQILVQSRRLDIHAYLDKLRLIMQQQTNELLRLQTQEYIEYITKLVEFVSIMNKNFYIVVPLSTGLVNEGFFHKLGNLFNPVGAVSVKQSEFEGHKAELNQRISQIVSTLGSLGLKTIVLNTEELIELLYSSYNLDSASPIKGKQIEEMDFATAGDIQ